jgi:hypothetical protein
LAAILTCAVVIVFHTTVGSAKLDGDDNDALSDYALKMAMAARTYVIWPSKESAANPGPYMRARASL